jgi:hypothetical protein
VLPNVFLVNPTFTEDELTAYWHYTLSVVPGLGQAFVDHVATRAGLAPSRFRGALDHPIGDARNHPDLRIQCDDYEVLFEHKLDSPLGTDQLQRYVDLASRKGWKLALMASTRVTVDDGVRQSPLFVRPQREGDASHFLWQDVHELVAASDSHIAREFKEYLEHLGLAHFRWAGLGNPFIDDLAAAELRSLYAAVTPVFSRPETSCRQRPNSLIYEVRRPFSPIHLLNLGPYASVQQWDRRLKKPVMAMWLWVRRPGGGEKPLLPSANGYIDGTSPRVFIQDNCGGKPLPYDREVFCERYYYIHLDDVLVESRKISQERLKAFVQASVDHLHGKLALVESQESA